MDAPRLPHPSRIAAPEGDAPAAASLSFGAGGAPRTQKVLNHAHTQQDVSGQMEKEAEWPHSPQGPRQRDRPEVRGRPSEGLRNAGPAPTSAPAWEPSQMGQRGPGGRQGRFPGPFHPASVHGGASLLNGWPRRVPGRHCSPPMTLPSPTAWGQTLSPPCQSSSTHAGLVISLSMQSSVSGW